MVLGGNERQLSPSKSFAGTWGEEIRRKKLLVKGDPDASRRFTTEAREAFSLEPFLKQKNPEPSKYNKFQQLQKNGAVIVNKAAYEREEISEEGVLFDAYIASQPRDTPFGKYSLSRPSSRAVTGDRPMTQAGKPSSSPTSHDEKLSTIFRDSYRPPTNPSPFDVESSVTMRNTSHRMLRSSDAPIAAGRSGTRTERGVSTSGLLGERLMLTEDPKWNTMAQKSWLYSDDPALMYKINGVPRARPVTDRSLTLPCELLNDIPQSSWNNHRRAILTGDLSTSTGRMRAGVFLDEFDPPAPAKR